MEVGVRLLLKGLNPHSNGVDFWMYFFFFWFMLNMIVIVIINVIIEVKFVSILIITLV